MRHQKEIFKIRKFRRIYDKTHDRFSFHVEYETHTEVTERTIEVSEAFGLGIDDTQKFPVLNAELQISPKDIVSITGDSGSGKSVLLRAIRADLGEEAIELSEVQVEVDKPIIETVGTTIEQAIELLSMVGLNDAFLFMRKYNQLSDGQKFRYRLAKFLESTSRGRHFTAFSSLVCFAPIVLFLRRFSRRRFAMVTVSIFYHFLIVDLKVNQAYKVVSKVNYSYP